MCLRTFLDSSLPNVIYSALDSSGALGWVVSRARLLRRVGMEVAGLFGGYRKAQVRVGRHPDGGEREVRAALLELLRRRGRDRPTVEKIGVELRRLPEREPRVAERDRGERACEAALRDDAVGTFDTSRLMAGALRARKGNYVLQYSWCENTW